MSILIILPEAGMGSMHDLDRVIDNCMNHGGTSGPVSGGLFRDPGLGSAVVVCHESDAQRAWPEGVRPLAFQGPNLTGARKDLGPMSAVLDELFLSRVFLVRDAATSFGYETYTTALRLMDITRFTLVTQKDAREIRLETPLNPPRFISPVRPESVLLKTRGGIGNVVMTTPILSACLDAGIDTYFAPLLDSGAGEVGLGSLFKGVPGLTVLEPGEMDGVQAQVTVNIEDRLHLDENDYFLSPFRFTRGGSDIKRYARFFENITTIAPDPARTFVGPGSGDVPGELLDRVVVIPGSKTGWDSKRWPHMNGLIRLLDNPVVLCRQEDIDAYGKLPFLNAISARGADYVLDYDLPRAASLIAGARAVVANDCGPAHMAVASGVPTLVLFGPSDLDKNRQFRDNVRYITAKDLDCRPCQGAEDGPGRLAPGDYRCKRDYRCLASIEPNTVLAALKDMLS